MRQFFRSLPSHFATAWKSVIRHPSLTVSSATAVTITLLIVGLLVLIAGNINNFTRNIEKDFIIQATISPGVESEEDIQALKKKIESIESVKSCVFSSKEKELQELIRDNGEMFSYYADHDRNPLYDVFIIELSDHQQMDSVRSALEKMEGIVSADFGGDGITLMVDVFESLRVGGAVFVVLFAFLAVLLIQNMIKMTIQTRQEEIAIMRNVGACNWYIRTPFIIEGMYIGILGSIVPILVISIGYAYVYAALDGVFLSSMFIMLQIWPFIQLVCLQVLAAGIIVGMTGSFIAAGKYLRWKR